MARKLKARVKFHGQFPSSKTGVRFATELDALTTGIMAAPMVQSFRRVMQETYPEDPPKLRQIIVTLTIP
jgi:hypothetical protein